MNQRIRRILIANRGEIACRIMATVKSMGLQAVAIHSDADSHALHVREADFSVALTGNTSAETYLDTEAIIDAARRSGADAIHPGYGFASENADFAERVIAAGLVWIGPTPHSIRQMAYKVQAKELAVEAGVPLVPGAELPDDLSDEEISRRASEVGFPLLIKASAGGGGKGMRVVTEPQDVVDAVAAARREARSAFGDGTVFCERYLTSARHVEVQVFGDEHGRVVHLFERECSIQRRHQKIIEESPAVHLDPTVADRMYAAATALARAIGYVGAGTVEFLVVGDGSSQEFFFLEMNTRLQVEHPVTEAITGIDLVEWQIRVARGEPLPLPQGEIRRHGHAVEVRLYAEDPSQGYLPNTGTLTAFDFDPTVRVDSGVESGSVVSAYYDPMLAKVIAHGRDRQTATDVLSRALSTARIGGVVTNRDSLVAICRSEAFFAGDTTTDFLELHPELLDPQHPVELINRHLIAASVVLQGEQDVPAGWGNVPPTPQFERFATIDGRHTYAVATRWSRDGINVDVLSDVDGPHDVDPYAALQQGQSRWIHSVRVGWLTHDVLDVVIDGVAVRMRVSVSDEVVVISDGEGATQWRRLPRFALAGADEGARGPSTPVPGTVTIVEVTPGDAVEVGDCLVVLEAMKMEHRILADAAGVVEEVRVQVGQAVDAHTVVVVLADAP